MKYVLPQRPDQSAILAEGLREAAAAIVVPPDATPKQRLLLLGQAKASARAKWDAALAAWNIACDEIRVSARPEIEALRAKASAIRADAAALVAKAAEIDAEAAKIEESLVPKLGRFEATVETGTAALLASKSAAEIDAEVALLVAKS